MRNHTPLRDGLSIQLSAGRFTFCAVRDGKIRQQDSFPLPGDGLCPDFAALLPPSREESGQDSEPVHVLCDTDRICLVPTEYYRAGDEEHYMQQCGIPVTADMQVVATLPRRDTVALIGVDRSVDACLGAAYGDRLVYTHPLFEAAVREPGEPLIGAALTQDWVHLTVHDRKLLFAETLPYHGEADLVYYLVYLKKTFADTDFRIELSGSAARGVGRRLSRRFRRMRVFCPDTEKSGAGNAEACDFTHLIRLNHENN